MLARIFLDHPETVDETYGEHARFASSFALRLLLASGAAFVHAVIPCLFEKTASRIVGDMYERTRTRGRQGRPAPHR